MKVMYNGQAVHIITTNHSMSIHDAIGLFMDINDPQDIMDNKGQLYVYLDDCGEYMIDWDGLSLEY